MTEHEKLYIEHFCDGLNTLYENNAKFLEKGDGILESVIYGIARVVEVELETQSHPAVRSCLESCIDSLRHAAFDCYASTK